MMRVVFIGNDKSILTGENGDSHLRHLEYAKHFDKLHIIIFSLKRDHLVAKTEKNLIIIPTNSPNRWLYLFDALKIISRLRPVDIISTQDPFVAGLTGVIAKFIWKIKLNIQIHNDFFGTSFFWKESFHNVIFYWLGKLCLCFTDSTRVVSPKQKIGKNCFVASVSADQDYFWATPHPKKFNQIVTVARLVKQKNLPLLFQVAKKFPNIDFVVVGEGEERKNLEKITPVNVKLLGQKKRYQIREILRKSDIFLLTSNYEGWAISVVEAIAAGLPIVMTDTGCADNLIINSKTGKVVPIGDQRAIVEAIAWIFDNWIIAKRYVLAGQTLLRTKYTRTIQIQKFIKGLKNEY